MHERVPWEITGPQKWSKKPPGRSSVPHIVARPICKSY
jgi:hypothetical protein